MPFIDERLDRDIESMAKRRPRYSTDRVIADGGWEVTNERWRYPLFTFEFNFLPGDPSEEVDDLREIHDFFHVAGGSAGRFLFRDWNDWHAQNQTLGVGDGSTTIFQLYRNYTRGALTRQRIITRPVAASVAVRSNGVTAAFTPLPGGRVQLTTPPGLGHVVAADFDFDLLVKFADDELEFQSYTLLLEQPVSVVLEQVRDKEY